jgi:PIN domain nuclease of toxin-antitoxin system
VGLLGFALLNPTYRSFDRLLIAQAQAEGMTLVSADGIFGMYAVELLVV